MAAWVIAAAPVSLYILGWILGRVPVLKEDNLEEYFKKDGRPYVREVGKSVEHVKAVATYFLFQSNAQKVFELDLVAVISLIISGYVCRSGFYSFPLLHGIVIIVTLGHLLWFLLKMIRGEFDPAGRHPAGSWVAGGVFFALLAVALDALKYQLPQTLSMFGQTLRWLECRP